MHAPHNRGATLIDVLIGIALIAIVFFGFFGAFRLSIEILGSNKSRIGAIALANEQMEFIRSLPYDSVGTSGGIPSGSIVQSEEVTLNETTYTRRTLIQFVDAPQDGLDSLDENGLTADYKVAKVEVSWDFRGDTRSYSLISNIVPKGIESIDGGGTLRINVFDALAVPVSGAEVRIVNATTSPAIDVTTFTNTSGQVLFPGSPQAASYEITVTKTGYSTASTYGVTAENSNPSPGHLSVVEAETTSSSFAIDVLGSLTVRTFAPIGPGAFADTFADVSEIQTTTDTEVVSGELRLLDNGEGAGFEDYAATGDVQSVDISPALLVAWDEVDATENTPAGTTITYQVLDGLGSLIPDEDLTDNSTGFTSMPVDISDLDIGTYPTISLLATLTTNDASSTPAILDWEVSFSAGPTPIANVPFSIVGAKTIGSDGEGSPIYKYRSGDPAPRTDGAGQLALTDMEWDSYIIVINDDDTGYDVAESCNPQPISLSPGEDEVVDLYLVADSTHSLLVSVQSDMGNLLEDASVRLYRASPSFDATQTTSACGQTFFESMTTGSNYAVDVSKSGYTPTTIEDIDVTASSTLQVILNTI